MSSRQSLAERDALTRLAWRDRPWTHPAIEGKHVVRNTRSYSIAGPMSVATCQCGWSDVRPVGDRKQDDPVEAHWLAVIAAAERASGGEAA